MVPLGAIWGLFGFTYYGLVLYVGRLYSLKTHAAAGGDERSCDFNYAPIFYNAASETLAVLISAALINRMGRRLSQSFFYALGGVAVACMNFSSSSAGVLFLAIVARMCSLAASVRLPQVPDSVQSSHHLFSRLLGAVL